MTVTNAVFPTALALRVAEATPLGEPLVAFPISSSSAFISVDSVFYGDRSIPYESVMHDALAESSGQTAYADSGEGVRDFVRRFSLPARGINWGVLHQYNGIDVAGACGSGVYAVAAGQVIAVTTGWGGGYGNYIDIDHGNNVSTRYAHAEEILVRVGQMVAGGDMVARMGSTGNSTGCHVHFEVRGSAAITNPFAR